MVTAAQDQQSRTGSAGSSTGVPALGQSQALVGPGQLVTGARSAGLVEEVSEDSRQILIPQAGPLGIVHPGAGHIHPRVAGTM